MVATIRMDLPMNPLVVIPTRLAASRLPRKPLADINGRPMILHCLDHALAAGVGPVVVAAGDQEIVDVVQAAGGHAVLTDPGLPSGSDRVQAAAEIFDPDRRHDVVINFQGDMPALDPALPRAALAALGDGVDIATLVVETEDPLVRANPNAAKAVLSMPAGRPADGAVRTGRALYFTRADAPSGPGPVYHHIGFYAFRRAALDRFVSLPPSPLELRERLEQLRALEAGLRIDAAIVDTIPFEVNTPEDLEVARRLLVARI